MLSVSILIFSIAQKKIILKTKKFFKVVKITRSIGISGFHNRQLRSFDMYGASGKW